MKLTAAKPQLQPGTIRARMTRLLESERKAEATYNKLKEDNKRVMEELRARCPHENSVWILKEVVEDSYYFCKDCQSRL